MSHAQVRRLLSFSAFGSLCLLSACLGSEEPTSRLPAEPRVPVVETVLLVERPFTEKITTFGVFEATGEVELAVDFSARVIAVHFDQGIRVEAGQVLVEFDAQERELQKRRAEATRDVVRAELDETRAELTRKRALAAGGVGAGSELDSAVLAELGARARYEDAVAGLALAERELQQMRLLSPVTGVVGARSVDPGEAPTAGAVLGTIETVDGMRVVTYVGEKDINHLRVGAEAAVTTPAVRGRLFAARIESLGIKGDPRTGNFVVRLALPNADGLLRPGMTARVELEGLTLPAALLVPDRAVVDRERRKVVFRVEDGVAVRVEPVLLPATGELVPVIDGLAAGDRVIVSGLKHVVDGSAVQVAEN